MSLNVKKMQEYCRLCQENLGTINVVNNDEFITKVSQCSNIKINDERMEEFPKSVCNKCHLNIEEMYSFIKQIQLIDKKLRDHFMNPIKLEVNTDIDTDGGRIDDSKKSLSSLKETLLETHIKLEDKSDCINDNTSIPNESSQNRIASSEVVSNECQPGVVLDEFVHINIEEKDLDSSQNHFTDEDNSNSESLDNDILDDKELKKAFFKNLYRCTYDNCSKVCTSSYTFRTHLMKHEGKTPFLCVTCGKGFRTKNSLNCHEKIHAKIKAYVCTECNIRFSVSSNLRAHQRKHHEGVRYYCSQCPLKYISKYSLERHELVHTGIKEYKCELCKAAFYTLKELTKHQRYHQGLRLYKCEQCFKTFFEKHHLTIHIRGHTGERPYVCKIAGCGKSFTESQKLTRHLKACHPLS